MIALTALGLLLAAPDEAPELDSETAVDRELPAPEPAPVDAGPSPDMEVGLEVGEPTGIAFAYKLNPAGRLTAGLGVLHRLKPFQFGAEAPMVSAGYEHDLMRLPVPGWHANLTVGAGGVLWLRGSVHRTQPLLALSSSVGVRLRRPESPLAVTAHLSPQVDLVPYVTPAVVAGIKLTWALSGAPVASAAEEPASEPVDGAADEGANPAEPAQPAQPAQPAKRKKRKKRSK